jgi:ABC-type Fe3+/spermidine/putrescine transport system ATPase subunit
MSGGQVAQTGTPREVYDKPVNRFVADFVGETNFLPGTVELDGGRPMFALAGDDRVFAPTGSEPGPATLMVRPESLTLREVDAPAAAPGITGRIVDVAFLGNHTRITLTTAAGDIVAVRPHGTIVRSTHLVEELGEEVCVWWPADDAALIGD